MSANAKVTDLSWAGLKNNCRVLVEFDAGRGKEEQVAFVRFVNGGGYNQFPIDGQVHLGRFGWFKTTNVKLVEVLS